MTVLIPYQMLHGSHPIDLFVFFCLANAIPLPKERTKTTETRQTMDKHGASANSNQVSLKCTVDGHAGKVTCCAFNQHGTLLATGGQDRKVNALSINEIKGFFFFIKSGSDDVIGKFVYTTEWTTYCDIGWPFTTNHIAVVDDYPSA